MTKKILECSVGCMAFQIKNKKVRALRKSNFMTALILVISF
ncbi:hypothetical protein SC1083_0685 [Aggregatibacter actinomycetemcomitans serotype e str. SC1083]|uniref:Uncharacterized protein n=1 Tax=Aggregatibacter actinomycetemcomitans serotype e str. SC1083 TaxID=907488 RepID=G4A793_AGGAC|nr:hypothetical protein SC1083_0685 [Aggregatibacter actinomycetemcomitans serotype e str. SC1083]